MSNKPRPKKKRRGPSAEQKVAARIAAVKKLNELMIRAEDRPTGPRIAPPTEGQEIKPYEGEVDGGTSTDGA